MLSTVTTVIGNSPADQFLIGNKPQTEGTTPTDFPQHVLNQAVSHPAKIPAEGIFTCFRVVSDGSGHDEKSSQGTAVSGTLT